MGGGEMYLPLEILWRTSLRLTFQRATWAGSLHWGCFSKVKMKLLKPSEDKPWVYAKIVVENCGITVPKILWFFFFFQIKLDGLFGEADTFLGTYQLLKVMIQFFASWFSFEGLHGKVINKSVIPDWWVSAPLVNVSLCVSSTHVDIRLLFYVALDLVSAEVVWVCLKRFFWGQKTWG